MEMMNSVIVTLVMIMKEIVIFIIIVKMVFFVDQTTVKLHWVLTLKLIAALLLK